MSWRQVLIVPKVARLGRQATRDVGGRWDDYWGRVGATGPGGEVLWDSGSEREIQWYVGQVSRYLPGGLPVVDVGCGNGRLTRALVGSFPRAMGVDLSPRAIARADEGSAQTTSVSFRALDMTGDGAGRTLAAEILPTSLAWAIACGLPRPSPFGERELRACFPVRGWETLVSGPTTIDVTTGGTDDELGQVPGYFAVLAARATDAARTGTA